MFQRVGKSPTSTVEKSSKAKTFSPGTKSYFEYAFMVAGSSEDDEEDEELELSESLSSSVLAV